MKNLYTLSSYPFPNCPPVTTIISPSGGRSVLGGVIVEQPKNFVECVNMVKPINNGTSKP
jgi:hypothetical protein